MDPALPKIQIDGRHSGLAEVKGTTKKTSIQKGFSTLYYSIDSTAKLKEEINTMSKDELELLKRLSNLKRNRLLQS